MNFCLFYLHWISSQKNKFAQNYWISQSQKPAYYAWAGYAFEAVCIKHANQIVNALNIRIQQAQLVHGGLSPGNSRVLAHKLT